MAEEEGGKHLSFSIIFLWRTFVNILVSIGEYFLTACSPCFLHYFPRRFKQAKLPLLLFFCFVAALQLVQRGQLSKQQKDNGDCLFTLLPSEVTKGQTWEGGERGRTRADRIPARWRRRPLPDLLMSACRLLIADRHSASPAAVRGSPWKKVEL